MLCEPCQQEYNDWLTPRRHHIKNTLPMTGGPVTVQAMRDAQTGNYEEWRKRVNFQLDLIINICQRDHQETKDADRDH